MQREVRTVCQGCHSECGVLVQVEDGKVTRIEGDPRHPATRGFICIKGQTYHQLAYHPDRVKYPLKRAGAKGEGKWQRVSWEQSLSEIAAKLTEIKEKYGYESNTVMHGTGPRASGTAIRFIGNLLNTPNLISVDLHICMVPAVVADVHTVGQTITLERGPDYLSSDCILVWGANPLAAHPPKGMEILEARRKRKARLIVVDPRRTRLASEADLWLQLRPGTDGALALALLNVIIGESLYDKPFVDRWCYGFDKLAERVKEYTPEKVAAITWVPAEKIKEAARMYATTKPAALHQRVAVNQNISSTQTSRALISLVAVTGNLDVAGGNLLQNVFKGLQSETPHKLAPQIVEKRIGGREHPLISGPEAHWQFVHSGIATETMLTGKPYPIKSLYCAGGDPVMCMMDSKKVWSALKKLELLVVADFFVTPTAELADYVLPATTWLERDECCNVQYNTCLCARQKAIEPYFECRDDTQIVIDLAKYLPWANKHFVPWNSVAEYNDFRVKGMGITFNELKDKEYMVAPKKYRKYESNGFNTPSGKVELYSTVFEKHGYDPLPSYTEPLESPVSTPGLLPEYPLILTTGARDIEYYHSIGKQVASLRKRVPEPVIELNPATAEKQNIKNGEWVWIETPRVKGERVKLKAKVTAAIAPGVVHAAHAWWFPERPAPEHGCFDSNINVVLSCDPPREPVCGSVPLRGTLCRVYKD